MVRLLLVGGKGGVGKTTISGATAVWAAQNGFKTLLISSDPAHSISDSFEQKIGDKPTSIQGINNLDGLEIDLKREMKEIEPLLKQALNEPFEKLGVTGFDFYSGDLMFPGLDEALAFNKLITYVENPEYDFVIFDTAPTGHTLRFLSLPELLDSWLLKLLKFRSTIQKIASLFSGKKDTTIEELEKLSRRVKHTRRLLADSQITSFMFVCIPEAMAVLETKRALHILQDYRITAHSLVVNNIYPEECDCKMCSSRRKIQKKYLNRLNEEFPSLTIAKVPLFEEEVKGIPMLEKISQLLYGLKQENAQLPLDLSSAVTFDETGEKHIIRISLPAADKADLQLRGEKNNLKLVINGIDYQIPLPFTLREENIEAEFQPNYLVINISKK
ncbi:MAG: AAA family ATPase [Candidatus Heimdallarchaeota archaeon]|nr:AAA family ATPase [Candidatus Heimdallarchaeota archaeon]